jgi:ABC-type cobalamin/Fe3+-siderophores transport system ATPase subunit
VTAQSLASANASVTTARAAQVAAHQALAHALRVNRDTIAAAELQVAQARGAVASGASRGSEPQPTQAATSAVNAARQTLAAAQAALADVRAVNAQQAVTLQHSLDAAQQDLAGDQARLQRDRTTERVLADEPTGNLDSESAEEVLQLFERLHGDGSTLVVVTHSHDVAQRASRILRMADGSLVADEETARKVVLQESR